MKNTALICSVLLLGLFGCTSQKKLVKEAPFTVESPSSWEFASGREQGGSGFTLRIPLEDVPEGMEFMAVYFRGHSLQPEMGMEDDLVVLLCEFRRESPDGDGKFVMHADPMEEVGNQPPARLGEKDEAIPFDLEADQAVLEYREKGTKRSRFFKIEGIKEKLPHQYPSRPKN